MKHPFLALLIIVMCDLAWAVDVDLYVTDCTGRQIVGEETILGEQKTNAVSIFASPGEYEPFSFALQPKERITDVMIHGGALTGPGGEISARNVVVRSAEGGFGANKMLYALGRTWNMKQRSR